MSNLMERLDSLRALIQEPEFLEGKGLSNEVNIRIFCYDPKDEMAVRHFTEKLMIDQSLNCHLIEYNLYKVFLSICDDKRITDRVAQQEEKKGKQFVLDQMKRMANNTAFINKMQYEPHEPGDVIMQPYFSDVPVLVMYPGTFDGRYVKLFDKLTPNPYYRAFNVI